MALGADYVTRDQLRVYMNMSDAAYDTYNTVFDTVISSASRAIEDYTHRQFNDAGAVSARQYAPVRRGLVITHDFSTVAGLIVKTDDDGDGVFETTWTIGTDFVVEPDSGIGPSGQPGWPFWKIRATGSKCFPGGEIRRVQVTAQWGWAAIPKPVLEAVYMSAADGFQYKDTRMGVAGADQFGAIVRIKDNGMAASKLKPYRRGKVLVR